MLLIANLITARSHTDMLFCRADAVKAGLSVVVLEKGGYFRAGDTFQQWGETEAMAHTLERGGVLATKDGSIMVS